MKFKTVAELLEDPGRWCQGEFAITSDGAKINPCDERAVQWCLAGACHAVYGPIKGFKVQEKLQDKLTTYIDDWNDLDERTHAEVLALVKELGI